MSNKPKTVEPDGTVENNTAAAQPTKFTIERLRKDCLCLFGVTFSTYDGATFGSTKEFSVEEMSDHIKKWQSKGIFSPETIKKEAN